MPEKRGITLTNVAGSLRTHGRRSTALSTLNTVTLRAMPTVRVATMVRLIHRFRAISRKANRVSCVSVSSQYMSGPLFRVQHHAVGSDECVNFQSPTSPPSRARIDARYGEASPELVACDRADERRRATPKTLSSIGSEFLGSLEVGSCHCSAFPHPRHIGGRRFPCPVACSNACASCSTLQSARCRPTI